VHDSSRCAASTPPASRATSSTPTWRSPASGGGTTGPRPGIPGSPALAHGPPAAPAGTSYRMVARHPDPRLIVQASADRWCRCRGGAGTRGGAPDWRLEVLEDVGHVPQLRGARALPGSGRALAGGARGGLSGRRKPSRRQAEAEVPRAARASSASRGSRQDVLGAGRRREEPPESPTAPARPPATPPCRALGRVPEDLDEHPAERGNEWRRLSCGDRGACVGPTRQAAVVCSTQSRSE